VALTALCSVRVDYRFIPFLSVIVPVPLPRPLTADCESLEGQGWGFVYLAILSICLESGIWLMLSQGYRRE
jgi:hypothetical protein